MVDNTHGGLFDILNDDELYLVKEDETGELVYVPGQNGEERQYICSLSQINWSKVKLYKPLYEYEINSNGKMLYKLDKQGNKIKIKKKLDSMIHEYIATKRMGFTINENNLADDPVEWITIDDLNKIDGNTITFINTKDKFSQTDIFNKFKEPSEKRLPIAKNDILVSFKMTIGVTKIFNTEQLAYCNEAIDIVTTIDKTKYSNKYIAYVIGQAYRKNTQQNVGSTTLNDDLKDLLFIQIPQQYNGFDSFQLQLAIVKNIQEKMSEINRKLQLIDNMKYILDLSKEKILEKLL